jgi:carboxymethylenebutenolidase
MINKKVSAGQLLAEANGFRNCVCAVSLARIIPMKPKLILLALFICTAVSVSAQDWAKDRLEKSPRHMEWVTVTNGTRAVQCWVVYPEVKDKATAVLVIHDSSGLTDWARLSADEVAAAGYIAIVPDFFSGEGPNGGGTSSFASQSDVALARDKLPTAQVLGDLDAAAKYVKALPSANGKLVVAGFCWGGSQASIAACNRKDLKSVFVFYGWPPKPADGIKNIQCPVYGFYGENDARVTVTVPDGQKDMKSAGKIFEPVIYAGAGHGFMAHGDPEFPDATAADRKARNQAWERLKDLLKKI